MDPMDYAFNHPSSSEAPYHIAVPSVSPPWIAYSAGPDVGNALDQFYASSSATLSLPLPHGSSAYANPYQYPPAQTGPLPWPSGFSHSSTHHTNGSVFSRSRIQSSAAGQETGHRTSRSGDSEAWDPSRMPPLPSLDSMGPSRTQSMHLASESLGNRSSCFNQGSSATQDQGSNLSTSLGPESRVSSLGQPSAQGLSWRSLDRDDGDNAPPLMLPSLRSQPYFHPMGAGAGPTLIPLQQNSSSTTNSRLQSLARSNFVELARNSATSVGEAGIPRLEPSSTSNSLSSTNSVSRTGRQSPNPRAPRPSHTQLADMPRPVAVSFDGMITPRIPSATPASSTTVATTASSPRRQRPSRTGARRHTATPRTPPHAHGYGRNSIDRPLVREFLASQNIGHSDKITTYSYTMIEEILYRNLQALQGSMGPARIARKSMVESLNPVLAEDLPSDERMCTICYGHYGIETPEGTIENAVRLPDCKHVFGSQCLRTWFEDSDKCPYCRKKLPSEPKWFLSAAKRVLAMIKRPHQASTNALDTETCLSVFRGYDRGGWLEPSISPSPVPRAPHTITHRSFNTGGSLDGPEGRSSGERSTRYPRTPPPERRFSLSAEEDYLHSQYAPRQPNPTSPTSSASQENERGSDQSRRTRP